LRQTDTIGLPLHFCTSKKAALAVKSEQLHTMWQQQGTNVRYTHVAKVTGL